jgi:hypothetical protein
MQNLINNENYKKEIDMTLSEFIDELLKLQKEGKGEYKIRWAYWSDEGDISEPPTVFDDEHVIYI